MKISFSKDFKHDPTKYHKTSFFHIFFITGGNGSHSINNNDYILNKGSLLTIRREQPHKFNKNQRIKGYLLLFTEDFIASQYGKVEVLKTIKLFNELIINPLTNLSNDDFSEILKLINSIKKEFNQHENIFFRQHHPKYITYSFYKTFSNKNKTQS